MIFTTQMAANQFINTIDDKIIFQSYRSIIAIIDNGKVSLSPHWNYSRTTMKYLNKFLGTSAKKEIEKKIKLGEYLLNIDIQGNYLCN